MKTAVIYENGQGFSFYTKEIRYTYKIAQRKECVIYDYKITMRIQPNGYLFHSAIDWNLSCGVYIGK